MSVGSPDFGSKLTAAHSWLLGSRKSPMGGRRLSADHPELFNRPLSQETELFPKRSDIGVPDGRPSAEATFPGVTESRLMLWAPPPATSGAKSLLPRWKFPALN